MQGAATGDGHGRSRPGGGGLCVNKTTSNSASQARLLVRNSNFNGNSAYGVGKLGDGGGVHADAMDVVELQNSTFDTNTGQPMLWKHY